MENLKVGSDFGVRQTCILSYQIDYHTELYWDIKFNIVYPAVRVVVANF